MAKKTTTKTARKTTKKSKAPKSTGGKEVESSVSGIGPTPVYRADLGESLPAQVAPKG